MYWFFWVMLLPEYTCKAGAGLVLRLVLLLLCAAALLLRCCCCCARAGAGAAALPRRVTGPKNGTMTYVRKGSDLEALMSEREASHGDGARMHRQSRPQRWRNAEGPATVAASRRRQLRLQPTRDDPGGWPFSSFWASPDGKPAMSAAAARPLLHLHRL